MTTSKLDNKHSDNESTPVAHPKEGQRWKHNTVGDVYVVVRKHGCWALISEKTGRVWTTLLACPDIRDIFGNAYNNNFTAEGNFQVMVKSWTLLQ